MRTTVLFPLTALVVAAGCGSEAGESAARSVPPRDLTLATQTAQVEIASGVELRQPQRAARPAPARRSRAAQPKVQLAVVAAPLAALGAGSAPVLAAAEPVAQPAGTAPSPNDRELLPGKTVTLIPASTGSSTGPDRTDDLPEVRGRPMVTGGGGTCRGRGRGRGPGIGIATGPRPDFR